MPDFVVIDTSVLQKANATLTTDPVEGRKFAQRLALLQRIRPDDLRVLISRQLLREYRQQVSRARNDFVRAFLELVSQPDGELVTENWARWSGALKDAARKCRFPDEDRHVLRTAYHDESSVILTEENRMLATDACIHRRLRMHVVDPTL